MAIGESTEFGEEGGDVGADGVDGVAALLDDHGGESEACDGGSGAGEVVPFQLERSERVAEVWGSTLSSWRADRRRSTCPRLLTMGAGPLGLAQSAFRWAVPSCCQMVIPVNFSSIECG